MKTKPLLYFSLFASIFNAAACVVGFPDERLGLSEIMSALKTQLTCIILLTVAFIFLICYVLYDNNFDDE